MTDPSVNSQYTFVIGVNDYEFGNNGDDLANSMALITVINNVQSFEFPTLAADTFNMTQDYYFFGCVTVDISKWSLSSQGVNHFPRRGVHHQAGSDRDHFQRRRGQRVDLTPRSVLLNGPRTEIN